MQPRCSRSLEIMNIKIWPCQEEDWVGWDRHRHIAPQSVGNASPAPRFLCQCHRELRSGVIITRQFGDAHVRASSTFPDRKRHAPECRRHLRMFLYVTFPDRKRHAPWSRRRLRMLLYVTFPDRKRHAPKYRGRLHMLLYVTYPPMSRREKLWIYHSLVYPLS